MPKGRGNQREEELEAFADKLKEICEHVGFKISARGWAYQLEGFRLINKNQLDLAESIINECRNKGYLPIDFVPEDDPRMFRGVEIVMDYSPCVFMRRYLDSSLRCHSPHASPTSLPFLHNQAHTQRT